MVLNSLCSCDSKSTFAGIVKFDCDKYGHEVFRSFLFDLLGTKVKENERFAIVKVFFHRAFKYNGIRYKRNELVGSVYTLKYETIY